MKIFFVFLFSFICLFLFSFSAFASSEISSTSSVISSAISSEISSTSSVTSSAISSDITSSFVNSHSTNYINSTLIYKSIVAVVGEAPAGFDFILYIFTCLVVVAVLFLLFYMVHIFTRY